MSTTGTPKTAAEIQQDWDTNPRWKGLTRNYTAEQVVKLQGSVVEEATLARRGSEILWAVGTATSWSSRQRGSETAAGSTRGRPVLIATRCV